MNQTLLGETQRRIARNFPRLQIVILTSTLGDVLAIAIIQFQTK